MQYITIGRHNSLSWRYVEGNAFKRFQSGFKRIKWAYN